jgi:hypothetical protein
LDPASATVNRSSRGHGTVERPCVCHEYSKWLPQHRTAHGMPAARLLADGQHGSDPVLAHVAERHGLDRAAFGVVRAARVAGRAGHLLQKKSRSERAAGVPYQENLEATIIGTPQGP